MAKVDFYVLPQSVERARFEFACKLAEKAWRLNHSIHIETMSRSDAERLDDMLWTFRPGSFVPHEIAGAGNGAPVEIGYGDATAEPRDLLISLCDEIPPHADTFPRIAELVTSDETCRNKSRTRFSQYRDRGDEINTHKL